MRSPAIRTMLALAVVLGLASLAAAQTGNEEPICRNDPNVFFCENFEDRALGPAYNFFAVPIYKNNGWAVSDPNTPDVVNTESADGTKSIRMTTRANAASGGAMDTTLLGGPYRTVYWRWYVKYSPNYVWSPIATKHNEIPINGESDNGIFNFVNDGGIDRPVITFALSAQCVDRLDCSFPPNINGGVARFNPNQWYCVEARLTMNTGASASDGYVQGWIDSGDGRGAVQYWEYPNVNLKRQDRFGAFVDNPRFSEFFLVSYWNCDVDETCHGPQPPDFIDYTHPEIYRYMDNIIGSTARIGCLGTPPTSSSPTPTAQDGAPAENVIRVQTVNGAHSVRSGPDSSLPPIGSIPDGSLGTVISGPTPNVVNGELMYDVQWDDQSLVTGWIKQSNLTVSGGGSVRANATGLTSSQPTLTVRTVNGTHNVRSGPDSSLPPIGSIPDGSSGTVISGPTPNVMNGELMYDVQWDDQSLVTGWIKQSNLTGP